MEIFMNLKTHVEACTVIVLSLSLKLSCFAAINDYSGEYIYSGSRVDFISLKKASGIDQIETPGVIEHVNIEEPIILRQKDRFFTLLVEEHSLEGTWRQQTSN